MMKWRKMRRKTKSLKPCYSGTTILLPAVLSSDFGFRRVLARDGSGRTDYAN